MALENINLLITDDHRIFRKSLIRLLETFPFYFKFYEAGNGLEAIEIIEKQEIDLLLLDIQMPVMNGTDCLKRIKASKPTVKAIILTQFNEPSLILHLLNLGADGFLVKTADPDELIMAIQQVINVGHYYNDQVSEALKMAESSNAIPDFSPREYQVAALLKVGLSNKSISNNLGLTLRTIESYRKSLMRKARCKNVAELTSLLNKTGMIIP